VFFSLEKIYFWQNNKRKEKKNGLGEEKKGLRERNFRTLFLIVFPL